MSAVSSSRVGTVAVLGTAQTLAWASTYYLPAMLAAPIGRDLGIAASTVFAAFSAALLLSAVLGPYAGRTIDRWGGRPVLSATSLVFAAGLAAMSLAQGPVGLFGAWLVMGVGMGCGLYEAAFAALVRRYGNDARGAITGITLIAGFASTVGWPLSTALEALWGWRGACLTWAALHLLVGLPLNLMLPKVDRTSTTNTSTHRSDADPATPIPSEPRSSAPTVGPGTTVLLSFAFAVTWFISTAMAAHLPRLLESLGASLTAAVAAGALIGPAQVGARLLEFGLIRSVHPLWSARAASLAHPAGAVLLLAVGAPGAAAFALMHGAGNGILTIAKGTLPLTLFGPVGYGARQGLLTVPARIAQAFAPFLFGLCLDRWNGGALWVSAALGLSAALALFAIARPRPSTAVEPPAGPADDGSAHR